MKYGYARKGRFEKALKYNKYQDEQIGWIWGLFEDLVKKGMSQGDLASLIDRFTDRLEPPNCWMSHCQYYGGVTCFCNCSKAHYGNLIPGRCKKNNEFKARQIANVQKAREKSYNEFKEACKDYPCVHYTGNFCHHMTFTDDNKIKECKDANTGTCT